MNEQPKISVIVPVYNTEKYLAACLDSLVNQTLKEIEIICVDDGSTDSSLKILREYEAKDSRLKVITQENKYAGVPRNTGIDAAAGKYVYFADSDDYCDLSLLEKAYSKLAETHADIVYFNHYRLNMSDGTINDSWGG